MKIEFYVSGIPKQSGSKQPRLNKKTGKMYVQETSDYKPWRVAVQTIATKTMYDIGKFEPTMEAVRVEVLFDMPRPKYHFGTGKNNNILKPGAPLYHDKKPDLDKLLRNTLDGLTGIVLHDDAQIASLEGCKSYALFTGARIRIITL